MHNLSAYFMIEGGRALELVKHHIAERIRVHDAGRALAVEAGAESFRCLHENGVFYSAQFKRGQPIPAGWTKPDSKGSSRPKKGSEWAAKLKTQVGYVNAEHLIVEAFDIPTSLGYANEGGSGWCLLGLPFSGSGFLWLSEEGPYAMWTPDVPACVKSREAEGCTVEEPAASFKLEFDGCRRIEKEEWEILVLSHKLKAKQLEAKA